MKRERRLLSNRFDECRLISEYLTPNRSKKQLFCRISHYWIFIISANVNKSRLSVSADYASANPPYGMHKMIDGGISHCDAALAWRFSWKKGGNCLSGSIYVSVRPEIHKFVRDQGMGKILPQAYGLYFEDKILSTHARHQWARVVCAPLHADDVRFRAYSL